MHVARKARMFAFGTAALALAGGIALAAPGAAHAGTCTGTGCPNQQVTGTANVSTTATLVLTATNFSVAINLGSTAISSPGIVATISSNDPQGYALDETLNKFGAFPDAQNYGFYVANGAACDQAATTCGIPGTEIQPDIYPVGTIGTATAGNPGNSSSASYGSTTMGNSGGVVPIASTTAANPGGNGDGYNIQWQFTAPGNLAQGSYTGSIGVLLVGN